MIISDENLLLWKQLHDETEGLKKPGALNDLISPQVIPELERGIIRVINRFLDEGAWHLGLKIFIQKELRNDLAHRLDANRPKEEEGLERWAQQIFEEQKFGIVFNSLEKYDNEFSELLCTMVHPLLKVAGLPLGGVSFLFFMGNYGFTPFGIHKDAKGEEGFLFHLGPGIKEFYSWDIEALNKIEHYTKVFHDIDEMLPSSKKHELLPGSVMFIPSQVYHIGRSDTFSLSIVMDYINPSKDYLYKELAIEIAEEPVLPTEKSHFLNPLPTSKDKPIPEDYIDSDSLSNKFLHALQKRIAKLQSQAGMLLSGIAGKNKILPNGDFKFRGKPVFPITFYKNDAGKVILFARGHAINITDNKNILRVITELNNGKIFSFQSLKNQDLSDWDLIDIYGFLNDLYQFDAIDIIL